MNWELIKDDKFKEKFERFLRENGAEVLICTNPFEVIRFRSDKGVSIVYMNMHGQITKGTNQAEEAWRAFLGQYPFKMGRATPRAPRGSVVYATLAVKYGEVCVYCGIGPQRPNGLTIEHFIPLSAGGKDHISNKGLACATCNRAAGSLPMMDKILMRDKIREQKEIGKCGCQCHAGGRAEGEGGGMPQG